MVRRTVPSLLEPDAVADLGALALPVERFSVSPPVNLDIFSILASSLRVPHGPLPRGGSKRLQPLPEVLATNASDKVVRAIACVIRNARQKPGSARTRPAGSSPRRRRWRSR